jgi:hypothetical protein
MSKTLNQIFFSSTKIRIFFQQHWESEYFFRKKTIATNTKLNNTWAFVIVKVKPTEKFSGSKRVSGAN